MRNPLVENTGWGSKVRRAFISILICRQQSVQCEQSCGKHAASLRQHSRVVCLFAAYFWFIMP
jgi:hypothetical protein